MKKNESIQKHKKRHRVYMSWEFEAAVEDLNKMSEQGWHITYFSRFSQSYVYDPNVTYRYQIDYTETIADPTRYYETFRDAGWLTVRCAAEEWNIFAKPYDPVQPEDAYLIYTDEKSKKEMLRRSRRFVGAALLMYAVIIPYMIASLVRDWFFRHVTDMEVIEIWTPLLLSVSAYLFVRWYVSVRRMEKGKKPRRFHYAAYMAVAVTMILASVGFILFPLFVSP